MYFASKHIMERIVKNTYKKTFLFLVSISISLLSLGESGNAHKAQWIKVVSSNELNDSNFYSVATDSCGNVYAAGYIRGTGTFTFSPGVTIQGAHRCPNAVLVKYSPSGIVQWAKNISSPGSPHDSSFHSVALDSRNNVYVGGFIEGTETYTFSKGITTKGTSSHYNALVVKYS
ncbi:MAG TPA: hypothetical protein PKK43_11770, partial [Spirochaetota bacterium]|nr:hypothetical protein [Spirochaetota bacterium]